MRLTFEAGYFILSGVTDTPDDWEKIDAKTFRTNSFKLAKRFKSYSTLRAQKIFDKAFVKFYEAPSLREFTFLDPHQIAGVRWILSRSRSYLAHAPGAGKTLQAILASHLTQGSGPSLFIVPPGLTINWEREIYKFSGPIGLWPDVCIVPISDKKHNMQWSADIIICPDSMLIKPWVLGALLTIDFKFIAVDEASRFKEPLSQKTIALFGGESKTTKSPGLIYKARHVTLMDGSPMPNRPMELWAPTYAMNPEAIDCMDQQEFGLRYCGAKRNDWGAWEFKHASHQEELKQKLQRDFMHVVSEDQLSHPERRRSMVFMDQDPRSNFQKLWDQKNLSKINFKDIDEDASQGELATMRRELGIRKTKWIAEYVRERLKRKNESILLFAWHREVCEALYDLLRYDFSPGLVMGGTKDKYRETYFADFQSGNLKLIVGNISAMGRGHNLQRADRIVFGEWSWSNESNLQCEKRASRKGSKKLFVRSDYIVAPGSLDEPVLNSVFTKAQNVKRIVG